MDWEGQLLLLVQKYIRCDLLNPSVIFITHLGDHAWLWIGIGIFLLLRKVTRKIGVTSLLALLLSFLINNLLLKNIIARTRPYETVEGLQRIIEKQWDYSFPSGHSASSFAVAVVLFYFFPKKWGIPFLLLAFLISVSRLYVGVHYPTDVLFGMLSGTFAALVMILLYRHYCERHDMSTSSHH